MGVFLKLRIGMRYEKKLAELPKIKNKTFLDVQTSNVNMDPFSKQYREIVAFHIYLERNITLKPTSHWYMS